MATKTLRPLASADPETWTWVPRSNDLYDDYPRERYIPFVPCAYAVPVDRIKGKLCLGCDEHNCDALFRHISRESLQYGGLLEDQDVRADFECQVNKILREWNDLCLDRSRQVPMHDDWDPDDEIETLVGQPSPEELNKPVPAPDTTRCRALLVPVSILSSNHQHPGYLSPNKDETSRTTTQIVIRSIHHQSGLAGEGHGHHQACKPESVLQQEDMPHNSANDVESRQNRTNSGGIGEGCHQASANDVQEYEPQQVVTPVRAQFNGASRIFQPATPRRSGEQSLSQPNDGNNFQGAQHATQRPTATQTPPATEMQKTIQSHILRGNMHRPQGQESHDRAKDDAYYRSADYHNTPSEQLELIERQMYEKRQQVWRQAKQNVKSEQEQPSIIPATTVAHIQSPPPISIARSQTHQGPARSSRYQVPQHRALTGTAPPHPPGLQPRLERTSRPDLSVSWRLGEIQGKPFPSPLRNSSSGSPSNLSPEAEVYVPLNTSSVVVQRALPGAPRGTCLHLPQSHGTSVE